MRRIIAGLLSASLAFYPEFTLAQIKPGGGAPVTAAGVSATSAGAIQGVTGGVPVPVTGTFTATLGGFTPATSGARMTPLAVVTTAGGTSGPLPTGQTVDVISNAGATNPMYCNVNGVAATTSDQLIPPDSWFAFTIPSGVTTLNCISTGGTTTANGLGGAGLPTGAGGGGGGGGSGGNVTIVGPLGTQAVAASVAVTPATSSVWPISASSLPLPTGAATAANQEVTAAGSSATSAQGIQGVTGGIPVPVTGSFSSTNAAWTQGATPMSAITLVGGTPQSNIAIPSGTTTLLITSANSGGNVVHCRLDTTTSTTASATDTSILAGQTLPFNATGLGVVACETGTGSQVVSFFPGSGTYQANSGFPPNVAAVGSTIGFAATIQGAATGVAIPTSIPDGGSVTLGTKADTALTTGSATEIALIKGLITQVQAGVYTGGGAAATTATGVLTGGSDGTDFRNFLTSTTGHLVIDCGSAGGSCSGSGGTSAADAAAWTAGTSLQTAQGCEFTSGGATALVTAHMGTVGCTTARALFTDKSSVGGTALVAATSAYGTAPTGTAVEGVNAFITNTNANGSNTSANSSPVVIASDQAAVATKAASAAFAAGSIVDLTHGQAAMAASVPVVIASNQAAFPVTATLAAGSALAGKVGIDQTTVGTTNGVALTQINAATTLAGTGAVGTGAQRIAVGTDTATIAGSAPSIVLNTAPQSIATGGASQTGNIVANNTTAVVVKSGAGTLYSLQLSGLGSAPAYLKIYNAASATCGSGTPVGRYMIPSASTAANGAGSNIDLGPVGVAYGTGITYCVTTGITDTDATAPAASTFLVNLVWK